MDDMEFEKERRQRIMQYERQLAELQEDYAMEMEQLQSRFAEHRLALKESLLYDLAYLEDTSPPLTAAQIVEAAIAEGFIKVEAEAGAECLTT